jgi:predicted DNA-binding mobile mystery protein A
LKKRLIKEADRNAPRRKGVRKWRDTHAEMRQKLDETLLAFRVARRAAGETQGWLRAVRQAVGLPVDEVARRMGVSKWEIFRMEVAEKESRIGLGTLRQAAAALDCELVYALTPRQGTLEDLAAMERSSREKMRVEEEERERAEAKTREEKVLKTIGWRAAVRRMIRRQFRAAGIRMR